MRSNRLLEILHLDEYEEPGEEFENVDLESTLAELVDYACDNGLCENSVFTVTCLTQSLWALHTSSQRGGA